MPCTKFFFLFVSNFTMILLGCILLTVFENEYVVRTTRLCTGMAFRHSSATGAENQQKSCSFAGPARKEWLFCFALFFLVTEL